jgi:tetratricopeptide (TPR) repeat protein
MPINGCKILGENPLPVFRDINAHKKITGDGTLSAAEEYRLGENTGFRVLPYRMQDNYHRRKSAILLKTAGIENDKLAAIFLPEQGGRLYSLLNKVSGTEILYKNPVFQPANLAIRNAWFSGGIEWNCAQYGHSVLTCSPVFFSRVQAPDGEEFLRMYEFDRMKRLYLQIDFHLPDGATQLSATITVYNRDNTAQSMYWWTNIAIPSSEKLRVFSGTEDVIYLHPESISNSTKLIRVGKVKLPALPTLPGRDATYPENFSYANEYFFQNPEQEDACWSAAAYGDGRIMFEASTLPLRFRKMFCWGNHQGGRRWCSYLAAEHEGDYVEMQAGLAPTQLHSIDIPANTQWSYTQAFGELHADGISRAYDDDYHNARLFVEQEVRNTLTVQRLQKLHEEYMQKAALPATEIISSGAGWGALEQVRAGRVGEQAAPASLSFPVSTIGDAELPWYKLLKSGYIPESPASSTPPGWMTDAKFRALLETSLTKKEGNHYLSRLHLGVMLYELGERAEGVRLWKESVEMNPSPIALRNLAYDARVKGDMSSAVSYMKRAIDPDNAVDKAFSEEYMDLLLTAKKYQEVWEYYQNLPPEKRAEDRISVLAGLAAVRLNEYTFVEALLKRDLACVREGDNSLTDIFFLWQTQKTMKEKHTEENEAAAYVCQNIMPPGNIDFRMFVKEP